MISVLCIFAVAARTLALVEGTTQKNAIHGLRVAARTLALVEGYSFFLRFARGWLQLTRWHWLPLARQRYLLNATILLFESTIQVYYSVFSTPNDFMSEFSL